MTTDAQPAGSGRTRIRWGLVLLGFLLFIPIILGTLFVFPPAGIISGQLKKIVREETGGELVIGKASYSLWPEAKAHLEEVKLIDTAGTKGELFRAASVDADLSRAALFKSKVDITKLTLVAPEFTLATDAEGRRNWDFKPKAAASPSAAPSAVATSIVLPETTITKGAVTYRDAKSKKDVRVEQLSATLQKDGATGAFASGALMYAGEPVSFAVRAADIKATMDGKSAPLDASLGASMLEAVFKGQAVLSGDAVIDGDLDAKTGSAEKLAKWLDPKGDSLKGIGPAAVKGKARIAGEALDMSGAKIEVDGTSVAWDGRFDWSGARPKLAGKLATARLDLDTLLGGKAKPSAAPDALESASAEADFDIPGAWDSLMADLDALEKGQPAPSAEPAAAAPAEDELEAARKAAWSEEPLDLEGLRNVDLDVTVAADEVAYKGLDLKKADIAAQLDDGALVAKIVSLDVEKGKATGRVSLDARADLPKADVALELAGVEAEPLMKFMSGKPLVRGKSNVTVNATATGKNLQTLTSTLNGDAKFDVTKGAMRGFDLKAMLNDIFSLGSTRFDIAKQTPFDTLRAKYAIKKGLIASAPDLSVSGSGLKITSVGKVKLPIKYLDVDVRVSSFPLSFYIAGDWTKKLSKGVSWFRPAGSSLESAGASETPLPAPEYVPAEVQEKIKRVLAANLPGDKLPDETRQILRTLLPREPVPAPAVPPAP